ncbi:MAG: NTP transferase domain-containing protein [Dehalococcoidales bacterium]|jgi:GTP:adenosylcobinamide-phosphate guanylyltransferase|nr:NTP transferase domain-containing protein [Dehalococcoidales bacterium]MDD3994531.1 NTP transferase domain-containing protein [Dehalococcoidales bacterium]NLT28699.1 NTP transferase domain-containing protein [Dehalococcoidales bacterium]
MDAIVLAGGTPKPGEPLYPYTGGMPKAMLEICEKPMIQWVLDALSDSESVDNVIIVGLPNDCHVHCSKKVYFVADHAGLTENLGAGAKKVAQVNKQATHALFVSSDIPMVTGEMVDWIINATQGENKDMFYNVISRQVMEKRFPNSCRTYIKFKDIKLCGSDLHVFSLRILLEENKGMRKKLAEARKSPPKQAALIGFGTLFLYIIGQLTLTRAERNISKNLKVTGKAVICPFAEAGMDVDKPRHLEIVTAGLQKRLENLK